MFIGVGVSCHISFSVSYLYVSFRGLITSVGEERAIFLLSFTCNNMVSGRRGCLFLLVLLISYLTLLSHSLDLAYIVLMPVIVCSCFLTLRRKSNDAHPL